MVILILSYTMGCCQSSYGPVECVRDLFCEGIIPWQQREQEACS
ncbi:hypothetical protein [Anaeromassilibacillus sp. SJQ-1]